MVAGLGKRGRFGQHRPAALAAKTKTLAYIVFLDGGLSGFAVANWLHALLDGAKITLIDHEEEHNDQPGYTLVAMDAFRRKGVNPVLTLPAASLKCAGAPLKMTLMQRERLAQSGTLGQPKVTF